MWSSTDSMVVIPIVLSFLSIATSYFVSWAGATWHDYSTAKRLGCKSPPRLPSRWPFGISLVAESLAADHEMRLPESLGSRLRSLGEDVTTCSFQIGFAQSFFTCNEENIQAVLAENSKDFGVGQSRRDTMFPLPGNGIFTQDGSEWRHSGAILRPSFSRQQMSDMGLEARHLNNLMRCFPTTSSKWTDEADIQTLFFRYTLDSASDYVFGGTVGSQLPCLHGKEIGDRDEQVDRIDFVAAFDKSMEAINVRFQYIDLGKFVWPAGFHQACQDCHQFVDDYFQEQLDRLSRKGDGTDSAGKERYLLFDALAAEVRDPVELRSILLNVLLAGRDTTAGLLSWIFYSLARDPDRYQKLRAAVLAEFGNYEDKDKLTFENLNNCLYLRHVIDESLRLYPLVPLNCRTAIRNTTLPRGGGPDGKSKIFVPKGSHVAYSVYDMQRRTSIWGEDADDFVPERWEGKRVGWEYLPFHGGPRICLGQQFALTKAAYVTARLVQKFDRIQNMDPEPVKHRVIPTMSSGRGVKVRLHEAP